MLGLVAIVPVGIWNVGSVVPTVTVGSYVQKGDKLGHFGSTIVLLFQSLAGIFLLGICSVSE
jgi:phosphatidylserine decarboxylase